jgi:glutathione S-transferase
MLNVHDLLIIILLIAESRAMTKYIAHQYADKGTDLACGDTK